MTQKTNLWALILLASLAASEMQIAKSDVQGWGGANAPLVQRDLRQWVSLLGLRVPRNLDLNAFDLALQEAEALFGVDQELLFSLAVVESHLNPAALSHKGAQGILQILPTTARWLWPQFLAQLPDSDPLHSADPVEALSDVRANTLMGAYYLSYLEGLFYGRMHHALASYNAGPGALQQALARDSSVSMDYVFRVLDQRNRLLGRII